MMIPKWIGSMPMLTATGKRIGVSSRIRTPMSITKPKTSIRTLMEIRMIKGLSEIERKKFVTMRGILIYAKRKPNAEDAAMMAMIISNMFVELTNILYNFLNVIFL